MWTVHINSLSVLAQIQTWRSRMSQLSTICLIPLLGQLLRSLLYGPLHFLAWCENVFFILLFLWGIWALRFCMCSLHTRLWIHGHGWEPHELHGNCWNKCVLFWLFTFPFHLNGATLKNYCKWTLCSAEYCFFTQTHHLPSVTHHKWVSACLTFHHW